MLLNVAIRAENCTKIKIVFSLLSILCVGLYNYNVIHQPLHVHVATVVKEMCTI